MTPDLLAEKFHNLYEELAPSFGYETRKDSAKPWADVPKKNKALMTEVCRHVLATCNELSIDELTTRFYQVREERNRLKRDQVKARELLDEASAYCPVALQDRIRRQIGTS